ncbi:MAG: hypothetical protein KDI71_04715 [Xanthomonadales bacterium]|nr:hypothetical protein [Xanthomonadales bacterium]
MGLYLVCISTAAMWSDGRFFKVNRADWAGKTRILAVASLRSGKLGRQPIAKPNGNRSSQLAM